VLECTYGVTKIREYLHDARGVFFDVDVIPFKMSDILVFWVLIPRMCLFN
jgi:hypothetical protein